MNDLKNIRQEWTMGERVALYIREKHPEIYDEAIAALVREEIEKKKKLNLN
jgi:hypothetical protein